MHEFWGRHTLCNMEGIDNASLSNSEFFITLLHNAVAATNATIVDVVYHYFVPAGMSVIAVLKESHVAIHTYPEYQALFLDVFTCGKQADPEKIVSHIIYKLNPKQYSIQTITRSFPSIKEKSF